MSLVYLEGGLGEGSRGGREPGAKSRGVGLYPKGVGLRDETVLGCTVCSENVFGLEAYSGVGEGLDASPSERGRIFGELGWAVVKEEWSCLLGR